MKATLVSRETFVASPRPGVAVVAGSYYTRAAGGDLVSHHGCMTRSDTVNVGYLRFSSDNGRSWSAPVERPTREQRPDGTLRRHPRGGYVDPPTGRYFSIRTEGVLPTDNPLEGLKRWKLHYSVSEDGGRTSAVDEQIIHEGPEFDPHHPLPGVWVGKNAVMLGDLTCVPITLADGTILVPCQITPVGPDGEYYNRGGGLSYHYAAVLRGRWRAGKRLAWTLSATVEGDPSLTTRGMVEPTIETLDDGRVLMVMRGSNNVKPHLPGYKWHAFSSDNGLTWTKPRPWTYTDGAHFYSPSACSRLLKHSSGALFWLGNLCPNNPKGNHPRHPFVVGEVDRKSGLLVRNTVSIIDQRGPGESDGIGLSNFYAREDRETGDIILHMSRLWARDMQGGALDWTADALQYRIAVE